MIIKELIIQQYSSYDKRGNCNIHLDGNLNVTLHAIVLDFIATLSKLKNSARSTLHLDYVITIPDTNDEAIPITTNVAGIPIINKFIENITSSLSTDTVSFNIELYSIKGYGLHVHNNRQNGYVIMDHILCEQDGEFIKQFHAIETNFEKTINVNNFDRFNEWRNYTEVFCTPKIPRKFTTRLNVSKHSQNDHRTALNGLESDIATLLSLSDYVIFNNQAQIDHINTYCPNTNPEKLNLGRSGVMFSKLFFNLQMETFRVRNSILVQNLVIFFTENEIKYLFPFRVTDPDWGYDLLTEDERNNTIITNPTGIKIQPTTVQSVYNGLTEDFDKRSILFTLYYLIGKGYIDVKIPLYSDMFNIMHQTTAELLHFIPDNVDIRFELEGTRDDYMNRYNNLILEN